MEKHIAKIFKALSDENRLLIIKLLLKGELCGCMLIDKLNIQQPTLSYHLKILTEAGITSSFRDGNMIKYVVNKDVLNEVSAFIDEYHHVEATCSL
ncbi:MAG: metalloregulator ArsR/SmtB family transcription factor [Acholeplasmataceae bacterium]|jgi:ArsR family transcriptional regulator|nr:metalloregulator ArsR/SmtB family transcription factor [Acholeplasmataceae bacterium]